MIHVVKVDFEASLPNADGSAGTVTFRDYVEFDVANALSENHAKSLARGRVEERFVGAEIFSVTVLYSKSVK